LLKLKKLRNWLQSINSWGNVWRLVRTRCSNEKAYNNRI